MTAIKRAKVIESILRVIDMTFESKNRRIDLRSMRAIDRDILFPKALFPSQVHNFTSLSFDWLIESGRDSPICLSKYCQSHRGMLARLWHAGLIIWFELELFISVRYGLCIVTVTFTTEVTLLL
jgi:hypothetical protein